MHYYPVGFVNSKAPEGNSTDQLDYSFVDNNITGDKQYYRLRQYDIDGKSQLSNVIVIRSINPDKFVLAGLYPNPVSNKLLIEIESPVRDMIKITAVNNTGQNVKEKIAVTEKGINTIDLNVHDLVPGIYILKVSSLNGSLITGRKFVKQ